MTAKMLYQRATVGPSRQWPKPACCTMHRYMWLEKSYTRKGNLESAPVTLYSQNEYAATLRDVQRRGHPWTSSSNIQLQQAFAKDDHSAGRLRIIRTYPNLVAAALQF